MLNVFFWFIFGMLIGWVAALLSTNTNIRVTRVVGGTTIAALVGGSILQFVANGQLLGHYNPGSIVASIVAAGVVAAITLLIRHLPTAE